MKVSKHVYFLRVADNTSKQQRLCEVVHEHFVKNHRILIAVPSNEAATFVDQLLWKMPAESFTPHSIANTSTNERVAITTTTSNVNKATVLINLYSASMNLSESIEKVYELLDLTTPEKETASRTRQSAYSTAGYTIEEK